jgi:hypothetical protein
MNMENKMKENKFDIVINVGPKDSEVIHKQIEYTKNNIIGYRNIYLITPNYDLKPT